ncbi:MAG: hypothetical protein AMS27_11025 [Bacteroides sp. SM23_62_1]|nr:MAG: hypothetical protein AMS27_11025 [Bacteroides sp. SM23_62_1]
MNTKVFFYCLIGLLFISFRINAEIQPESIFKEFYYKSNITPPGRAINGIDSISVFIDVDDLVKAVKAEICIQYWGGHIGTSEQKFKINDSELYDFPQPPTPGSPYCYYRNLYGKPAVEIPLNNLEKGQNKLTFYKGEQICYSFNWAHYVINSVTIRIYYSSDKECAKGKVIKIQDKDTAYQHIAFRTEVDHPENVVSVQYIGYFTDYDWDGDGIFTQWQYRLNKGSWEGILNTQYSPPYAAPWDNFWLPQQEDKLMIAAKINSANGCSYITRPVEYKALKQHNFNVIMYRPDTIPEVFGVRVGREKECIIKVEKLDNSISAFLVFTSWSGATEDGANHEVGLNGNMIADNFGILHEAGIHMLPVPIEYLKEGDNIFHIFSNTEGHALEINWPGPAILVRYCDEGDVKCKPGKEAGK